MHGVGVWLGLSEKFRREGNGGYVAAFGFFLFLVERGTEGVYKLYVGLAMMVYIYEYGCGWMREIR